MRRTGRGTVRGAGGGAEMVREELLNRLHDLTGEFMSLGEKARELGEDGVAEQLDMARAFLVAAAGRMELEAEARAEAAPAAEAVVEEEDTGWEPTEEERKALYSGEVELALMPPLDAAGISRLYSLLLSNPDIEIMRMVGSWEKGTSITVFLEGPLRLASLLTEIPGLRLSTRPRAGGPGGAFAGRIATIVKSGMAANEAGAGGDSP